MKRFHFFFLPSLLLCVMLIGSCCKGSDEADIDPDADPVVAKRTVIAYLTADNNLSTSLQSDLSEMVEASKNLSRDCNLIAFIDKSYSLPYIAKLRNGKLTKVKEWGNDFYSVSPDSMLSVFRWIINKYPAEEYAAMFAGHGSGPMVATKLKVESDLKRANTYSYDHTGESGIIADRKCMNISQMADVMSHLPHMAFIFFDCCCMQSVEVAYELRRYTDYIIAAPCEIPNTGAPYPTIVPVLSEPKDKVCQAIAERYIKDSDFGGACGLCLSVVKTSEMDNLLQATRRALATLYSGSGRLKLSVDNAIYYYRSWEETNFSPILHDIKSVMKLNLTDDAFQAWLPYLNNAVIVKYMPQPKGETPLWTTSSGGGPSINFRSFLNYFDEAHYGAISMIVPNETYEDATSRPDNPGSINTLMYDNEWARNVGWKDFGW